MTETQNKSGKIVTWCLTAVAWGMLATLTILDLLRVFIEPLFYQEAYDLFTVELRMWWRDTKFLYTGNLDPP